MQMFKVRVKVSYFFYFTLKIFNDFSQENHGHGGHEHGVCRGVFGGRLSDVRRGSPLYFSRKPPFLVPKDQS
jgi:hypothetical protein